MITVHQRVHLRHGRALLEGEVVELLDDGRKAKVRVERDGEAPLDLVRNVSFLDPVGAAPGRHPVHPKES